MENLDNIDRALLNEIQQDSRISNSELARRIKLSQPATHARLKRLETLGVVRQHVSLLDRDKLGLDLICFFQVRLEAHSEQALLRFEQEVIAFPEVLECHYLTGQFDYLLKAVFENRRSLEQFERQRLRALSDVAQITTSVTLSEIKMTTVLPLPKTS
jgi:Lrp/AsnC family leucine-responsive transcriptional regulator